jgi:hypothetical protein
MLRTKAVRRVWQMSRPVGTCILVFVIVAFRFIHLYAYMHVYIRHLTFYFSIYIDHIGPGSEDRRKFQRLPMSVVSRASGCKGSIFGVIGVRVMFLEATDDRAADGQLVGWSAGRVCFSLHNLSFCKGRNGYRWQLIIHKWSQGLVREALSLTSQPQVGYRN